MKCVRQAKCLTADGQAPAAELVAGPFLPRSLVAKLNCAVRGGVRGNRLWRFLDSDAPAVAASGNIGSGKPKSRIKVPACQSSANHGDTSHGDMGRPPDNSSKRGINAGPSPQQ